MSNFTLSAQARNDLGKGASRRLRREAGLVPAIIYGGSAAPVNVMLAHKDLAKMLEDAAVYTSEISLVVDGAAQNVKLKDLQRHPAKPFILHADFIRA